MNHTTASPTALVNGKPVCLSEAHRRELVEGSGLTDDTIQAAGIHTETNHSTLAAILNRKSYSSNYGPGLVFPYHDLTGAVVLQRVKPTHPPQKNGKPQKYLQPSGVPVRAYFPPKTQDVLQDASARLLITEGEKKALAATQAGFPCVGLMGVDCWHPKHTMGLLPDLAAIQWKGREVYVAFDSDAASNENVLRAERQLAAALQGHGARVRVVRIPPGENGTKQGIDDYLVRQGAAEFQKLLENASEPEAPDSGELKVSARNLDPADEAEHILAGCKVGALSKLRFWRGGWWWWASGSYREKAPEETRAQIVNSLNQRWLGVHSRTVGDVLEHLRAKAILSGETDPGTWLGKSPHGWNAVECLATKSEVVHLPSLVARRDPLKVVASPAYFTTTALDFSIDVNAPPPQCWLEFLQSLWADDSQSVEVLQETFGYLLTLATSQQKMFMLVGPKRSGKGTIARVLRELVGKGNVVAPTLASLTGSFGLQPLLGKSVAIIADARLSGRTDQAVIVERLLSITGEDTQTVERKHQTSITCKLPTRFLILSNELPKLTDASGAVVSRVIMLTTNRSFYGKEDHRLFEKLLPELPGIFLWAVGGWNRLQQRGRFVQPDSSLEALGELHDLASPVACFLRDRCRVAPGEVVAVSDLFAAWRKWCESQGREKYSGNVQSFARDLMAVEPQIRRRRLREGEDRTRVYEGVGLLESAI